MYSISGMISSSEVDLVAEEEKSPFGVCFDDILPDCVTKACIFKGELGDLAVVDLAVKEHFLQHHEGLYSMGLDGSG